MNHTEVGRIKQKINTSVLSFYLQKTRTGKEFIGTQFNGCFSIRHPLQAFIADTRWLDKIKRK
jgi:hypothetical protein